MRGQWGGGIRWPTRAKAGFVDVVVLEGLLRYGPCGTNRSRTILERQVGSALVLLA